MKLLSESFNVDKILNFGIKKNIPKNIIILTKALIRL